VTPDSPDAQQTIAAPGFSFQQTPIRPERLAYCRRVNMERALHDNGAGPDAVHQLIFGNEFAGRLREDSG
jgi:hypothetical protein